MDDEGREAAHVVSQVFLGALQPKGGSGHLRFAMCHLFHRYITASLIDNRPAPGCTGGALTSDDSQAGPLMLQGDHSDIDYRNMVLTPVSQ